MNASTVVSIFKSVLYTYSLNSTDVDECTQVNPSVCSQRCSDTIGSYICSCESGYRLNTTDLRTCDGKHILLNIAINRYVYLLDLKDVDECVEERHTCDMNADCTNTEGSYYCTCREGYSGEGSNGTCHGNMT